MGANPDAESMLTDLMSEGVVDEYTGEVDYTGTGGAGSSSGAADEKTESIMKDFFAEEIQADNVAAEGGNVVEDVAAFMQEASTIDHYRAKEIASNHHGGHSSPLYSFITTGAVTSDAVAEAKKALSTADTASARDGLIGLINYLQFRSDSGETEPVPGWEGVRESVDPNAMASQGAVKLSGMELQAAVGAEQSMGMAGQMMGKITLAEAQMSGARTPNVGYMTPRQTRREVSPRTVAPQQAAQQRASTMAATRKPAMMPSDRAGMERHIQRTTNSPVVRPQPKVRSNVKPIGSRIRTNEGIGGTVIGYANGQYKVAMDSKGVRMLAESSIVASRSCPKCSVVVKTEARFCGKCGQNLMG